jgi:hypothetical protein
MTTLVDKIVALHDALTGRGIPHAFHDIAEASAVSVSFVGTEIPVLGANELAVFKAFFDRTKDWADIEAMLDAGTLDLARVQQSLDELLGPHDHRSTRFRELAPAI